MGFTFGSGHIRLIVRQNRAWGQCTLLPHFLIIVIMRISLSGPCSRMYVSRVKLPLDNDNMIMVVCLYMTNKKIDNRLTILLTDKQKEQLRIAAFNSKQSVGTIIRLLIENYLEKAMKG